MVRINKILEKIFNGNRSGTIKPVTNDPSSSQSSSNSKKSNFGKSSSLNVGLLSPNNDISFPAISSTNESVFSNILNENFICNCCLELLKNPITLLCGHSFCLLCLADWYLISSNRKCPICRQEWYGVPKQNQALKSTIKKLVKYDVSNEGYNDKLTKEDEKKIKTFQQKCAQYGSSQTYIFRPHIEQTHQRIDSFRTIMSRRNINNVYNFVAGLFMGILLTAVSFSLIWLIFGGHSSKVGLNVDHSNTVGLLRKKYSKPPEIWTVGEIQEWFYALGPWTSKIASVSQSLKIGI